MSALAVPLREESLSGRIVKLFHSTYPLDPYHDRLVSVGYQVFDASLYADALKIAYAQRPDLILVFDAPHTGIDALHWIELQHNDLRAWLAVTPLMIIAEADRMPVLQLEALPDRVVVMQRRADTLNQLTRMVKYVLKQNRW
jgi:hypothetical protein